MKPHYCRLNLWTDFSTEPLDFPGSLFLWVYGTREIDGKRGLGAVQIHPDTTRFCELSALLENPRPVPAPFLNQHAGHLEALLWAANQLPRDRPLVVGIPSGQVVNALGAHYGHGYPPLGELHEAVEKVLGSFPRVIVRCTMGISAGWQEEPCRGAQTLARMALDGNTEPGCAATTG